MSSGWSWLAVWLLLPVLGAPVLAHRAFGRFSLVSRVVLAGAVGSVLVSFSMTAFALFGIRWTVLSVAVVATLVAFGVRPLLPEVSPLAPAPEPRDRPATLSPLVSSAAVLAAFLATIAGSTGSPDLLFFWGLKAQRFAAARTIDAAFLREPLLQYAHPYYPPLWTNLGAFSSMAAGRFAWMAATLTFPLVLAALALGLPGVLRLSVRRRDAAAIAALVVSAIACTGIDADIGGNAEMPLLFFETLAIALLLAPGSAGREGEILGGMMLAGAASTKVEGLPFVLAAAVLGSIGAGDRPGTVAARAARLLAPTAIALGAWFAFGVTRRVFVGYSGQGPLFDPHPEHFGEVIRGILSALGQTGWGLPWLIPLLVGIAVRPRGRGAAIPLGVAAALVAFLLFTYIDRAGDPSTWISWSAARVFSPVAMLLALAATGASGATFSGAEASPPRTPSPSPP